MLVRDYMVPVVSSVELGASLASAANLLRSAELSCVPVFEAGTLCGLLDERDLLLAQELGVSAHDTHLNDLPLHDAYVTSPDASLMHVARAMAIQKSACAVVQRGQHVVGLLPWQAALVALVDRSVPDLVGEDLGPAQVRSLILTEHASIRRLLRRVELIARRIITAPIPRESDLRAAYEAAHALCATMATHFEHEEKLLAPALEALDAWGKIRADQMRADHAEQGLVLESYLSALERLSGSEHTGKVVAALIQKLVDSLRSDMRAEEEGVLRADLLRDDPSAVLVECG
jgi:iron-sulfur cluster repair protein YtfE (RIC family)